MSNAYPEKPIFPYQRTTITMDVVVAYLRAASVPVEVKRSAYIMFRVESANGQSGVNNNYAGCQADGGRWPAQWDDRIIGVVQTIENGTGRVRLFAAFDRWQSSVDFLLDRVQQRGLYVGGTTSKITQMSVGGITDLCTAYVREWATGIPTAKPSSQELANWTSMYQQACEKLPLPVELIKSGREEQLADALARISRVVADALTEVAQIVKETLSA